MLNIIMYYVESFFCFINIQVEAKSLKLYVLMTCEKVISFAEAGEVKLSTQFSDISLPLSHR